jgi:hypothetical protein
MQCFVIQDTLQISSFVLDIIKTISLSPRRTIPVISSSQRIFSVIGIMFSNPIPSSDLPSYSIHVDRRVYISHCNISSIQLLPIPSIFDKKCLSIPVAHPHFFFFAAQSDLGFATHFEYCDIKRLINNKTPYDIPTILLLNTPRASLPR